MGVVHRALGVHLVAHELHMPAGVQHDGAPTAVRALGGAEAVHDLGQAVVALDGGLLVRLAQAAGGRLAQVLQEVTHDAVAVVADLNLQVAPLGVRGAAQRRVDGAQVGLNVALRALQLLINRVQVHHGLAVEQVQEAAAELREAVRAQHLQPRDGLAGEIGRGLQLRGLGRPLGLVVGQDVHDGVAGLRDRLRGLLRLRVQLRGDLEGAVA